MKPDEQGSGNIARFFTHNRQIAWVALAATLAWGVFGYMNMPKRKDPDIPVRVGLAIAPWPGIASDKVEQLVTRKIEQAVTGNDKVDRVESTTQDNMSVVQVRLLDSIENTDQEFQDIGQRLAQITDLPDGAGPITWISDFGDTASLMLTVASPPVPELEIELRARGLREAIAAARGSSGSGRATVLYCYPGVVTPALVERPLAMFADHAQRDGVAQDVRLLSSASCSGVDFATTRSDASLRAYAQQFVDTRLQAHDFHPDSWGPIIVRDPAGTKDRMAEVGGERYSYRQLDDFTDLLERTLQRVPIVAKVDRAGVLPEQIYLEYSHDRLAAFDLQASKIKDVLGARNVTAPAASSRPRAETSASTRLPSSGARRRSATCWLAPRRPECRCTCAISCTSGAGYESPTQYLNHLTYRDARGEWQRTRAITLAVQMRAGEQIADFGEAVDAGARRGPVAASARPGHRAHLRPAAAGRGERRSVHGSLYEAIVLVVLVALIGFWEWRSALLMALCIPITLAMTFGVMRVLGIDIQQVSIASLIIALGLLVDDPVVAGDAIKRELGRWARRGASRPGSGRRKLAKRHPVRDHHQHRGLPAVSAARPATPAASSTALPVVLTASLVASRLVSMTFMPLLGMLPAQSRRSARSRRWRSGARSGFARLLLPASCGCALRHRWLVLGGSLASWSRRLDVRVAAEAAASSPRICRYLSYVDVWLPEDAPSRRRTRDGGRGRARHPRGNGSVSAKEHHVDHVLSR